MKISVIVPFYNAGWDLETCLDSILSQTYSDWELLLVDDGSTDISRRIAENYAAKDDRITVLHKLNGGVSSARNLGLDNARGEWITFVDADDWLDARAFDYLLQDNNGEELIIGGLRITSHPASTYIDYGGSDRISESSMGDFLSLHIGNFLLRSPCSKLFKRSKIEKVRLRFNEKIFFGEDNIFVTEFLLTRPTIKLVDNNCYYYRVSKTIDYSLKYYHKMPSICQYYLEMNCLYSKIDKMYGINTVSARTETMMAAFHLLTTYIVETKLPDRQLVRSLILSDDMTRELSKWKYPHAHIILYLAKFGTVACVISYIRFYEFVKRCVRHGKR